MIKSYQAPNPFPLKEPLPLQQLQLLMHIGPQVQDYVNRFLPHALAIVWASRVITLR